MSEAALREILAKFGFDYDKSKLAQIDAAVENTKKKTEGATDSASLFNKAFAALGAGAVIAGIKGFIGGIEHLGSSLNDLSEQTGAGAQSIQLFQFITGQSGVAAEEADAAIRKLSVTLGNAAAGGGEQAKAFTELGLAYKDSSGHARKLDDVLPELFESFGKITDDAKASRLAVDLFGRSGVRMLGALKQGKPGFAAFRAEFEELGGGLSDEAIKAADEYGDSLFKLNFAFTSIKSMIGAELFPKLTELVGGFAKGVSVARRFAKDTNLVQAAMVALGIAGVAAITALLAPFAPIIAAVSALTLVIDDFIGFLKGEDSLIGAIFNDLFGKETTAKIKGGLSDIGTEVKAFFEDLIKHPKKFVEDIELLFKGVSAGVKKFFGLSSEAEFQAQKGTAVTDQQKAQAKSDEAFFNSLPETFGSKNLSRFVYNQVGGLFGKDTALSLFGRNPDGSMKEGSNPFTPTSAATENGWAKTELPESAQPKPQEPVKVAVESQPEDWFAHIANSFGNLIGVQTTGTAAPVVAPVPGGPQQPSQNTVQQTNTNHFHISADTPEELQSAVEKGATNAIGNERRAALAALESHGGG